jgi:DNA-binding MarR family transcriptional regulator
MTEPRFDEEIHAPARLKLCAALARYDEVEFAALKEPLGVADSVLSKHVARLEQAGYVKVDKRSQAGHIRTWLALTPAGRTAYQGHIAALRELAGL